MEEVGVPGKPILEPSFLEKAPHRRVPVLELDDGTLISEAMAICRYFEAQHPEPPLMGADPLEMARVEMWERMSEFEGLLAVAESFRNANRSFAGRALPGVPGELAQIPELIERGKRRAALYFDKLETRLGEAPYLAGEALHRRRHHRLVHRRFREIHRDRGDGRPSEPRALAGRGCRPRKYPRDGVAAKIHPVTPTVMPGLAPLLSGLTLADRAYGPVIRGFPAHLSGRGSDRGTLAPPVRIPCCHPGLVPGSSLSDTALARFPRIGVRGEPGPRIKSGVTREGRRRSRLSAQSPFRS